jgi:broad specificity phosphatase PhoE
MKLVLVRHLPTAWNREGRLQGRRDIPLESLDGAAHRALPAQAALAARHGPFDRVTCSTLQRTRQTAELFGYAHAQPDPLLDELDFGTWEGALKADFMTIHGHAWLHAPEKLSLGEPVASLGARVSAFIDQNLASNAVLAFGHGAWIRAARALHETGSISAMNQRELENSEVVVLEYQSVETS